MMPTQVSSNEAFYTAPSSAGSSHSRFPSSYRNSGEYRGTSINTNPGESRPMSSFYPTSYLTQHTYRQHHSPAQVGHNPPQIRGHLPYPPDQLASSYSDISVDTIQAQPKPQPLAATTNFHPLNKSLPTLQAAKLYPNFNAQRHSTVISPDLMLPLGGAVSTPQSSNRLSLPLGHKRLDSNPFDVLYSPETASQYQGVMLAVNTSRVHQVVETPSVGERPALHYAPIVTVLESSLTIRRSGSVLSTSASLHKLNTLRSRNKTVYRKSSTRSKSSFDDNGKTKKASLMDRVKYVFLVKRRKSLKYTSLKKPQKPKFANAADLKSFLTNHYPLQVVKDALPKPFWYFKYKNKMLPTPKLIKMPLEEKKTEGEALSRVRELPSYYGNFTPLHELVYQKYKMAVFANNLMRPPRFQDVYPTDSHLLSRAELNQINKKLLFEVLLRRTLAAKIGYRLKSNGIAPIVSDSSVPEETESSGSSTETDSDNGDNFHLPQEISMIPRKPSIQSSMKGSMNTEVLMQQNVSLYSGLLPSPQISYASEIFGSLYSKASLTDRSKGRSESENDLPPITGRPKKQEKQVDPRAVVFPAQKFAHDFNREADNKHEKKSEEDSFFNSSMYQLRPLQRSVGTFNSSEKSFDSDPFPVGMLHDVNPAPAPKDSSLSSHKSSKSGKSTKSTKSNKSSTGEARKSYSTGNDSIFQNLDDLSSEISSYLDEGCEKPTKEETGTELPKELVLECDERPEISRVPSLQKPSPKGKSTQKQSLNYMIQQKGTSKTILESLNDTKDKTLPKLQIINVGESKENSVEPVAADIKSMKGSILGLNTSSSPYDHPAYTS